jgi:hypothetical protein
MLNDTMFTTNEPLFLSGGDYMTVSQIKKKLEEFGYKKPMFIDRLEEGFKRIVGHPERLIKKSSVIFYYPESDLPEDERDLYNHCLNLFINKYSSTVKIIVFKQTQRNIVDEEFSLVFDKLIREKKLYLFNGYIKEKLFDKFVDTLIDNQSYFNNVYVQKYIEYDNTFGIFERDISEFTENDLIICYYPESKIHNIIVFYNRLKTILEESNMTVIMFSNILPHLQTTDVMNIEHILE